MSLPPQFLDELRARTSLSALIARSVKLQKAGREYKACCPFHSEKTPSFTVNDEKHFYHCFGCGAHGDAIRFLTDARGLQFMDAVKELADAAGMELPAPDPQARQKAERQAGLHDVMAAAAAWFREQLGGLEGSEARAYLQKRGITANAQADFGIGYAPDSRGKLKDALRRFGKEALIEAGLLIQPEGDAREPYDRFRGRLMIPIRDPRGRVIAFGGRIIASGEPKYLNSPDTPLFDKGRTLYNLDRAAAAARTSNRMIVVEGYLDVVALAQAGIGEAVAPLGTALTENQLDLLWRHVGTPLLCFDGDSAGQRAADRALLRALPMAAPGRSLAFVTLPAGQDPDDLIRAGGRAAMEVPLAAPQPLVDRLWRSEREAEPLDTPESKAGLRRRLLERADRIGDHDVRDQYRAELMRRFGEASRPPRREFTPTFQPGTRRFPANRFQPPPRPTTEAAKALGTTGLSPALGRAVLTGLLHFPEVIAAHTQAIATLPIAAGDHRTLRDLMLEAAFAHESLDRGKLLTILTEHGAAGLGAALRQGRGLSFSFTRANTEPERAQRDLVLVVETLAARPELDAAYRAATDRLKENADDALFEEQKRLRTELEDMDRRLSALILDGTTS